MESLERYWTTASSDVPTGRPVFTTKRSKSSRPRWYHEVSLPMRPSPLMPSVRCAAIAFASSCRDVTMLSHGRSRPFAQRASAGRRRAAWMRSGGGRRSSRRAAKVSLRYREHLARTFRLRRPARQHREHGAGGRHPRSLPAAPGGGGGAPRRARLAGRDPGRVLPHLPQRRPARRRASRPSCCATGPTSSAPRTAPSCSGCSSELVLDLLDAQLSDEQYSLLLRGLLTWCADALGGRYRDEYDESLAGARRVAGRGAARCTPARSWSATPCCATSSRGRPSDRR